MKTKTQIKTQIAKSRQWKIDAKQSLKRNGIPLTRCRNAFAMADVTIQVLQWVLGYKMNRHYYCSKCQLRHLNPQCPQCGSANVLNLTEKVDDVTA